MKLRDILLEKVFTQNVSDINQYAKLVAKEYRSAPRFDPKAKKHWDALLASSKKFYHQAMSDIEIIYSDKEVYNDAAEMKADVHKNKRMFVSREYTNHPIWTDREFQIFRAVHDYIVHVEGNSDFTLKGELRATNLHARLVPKEARPAVFLEIAGKVCYYLVYKQWGPPKIAVLDAFDYVNIGRVYPEKLDLHHKTKLTPHSMVDPYFER